MTHAIGANLYGFIVGGILFYLQLLVFGSVEFFSGRMKADILEVAPYAILGAGIIFFLLAALYWLSSVLIVFPALFIFRALRLPAPVTAVIGGVVAGLLTWCALRGLYISAIMHPSLYFSILSSSIVTGTVTGYALARLITNTENKLEMLKKPSEQF